MTPGKLLALAVVLFPLTVRLTVVVLNKLGNGVNGNNRNYGNNHNNH
jgi:hypothetical protein